MAVERLMALQRRALSRHTPPGAETQIEATATLFNDLGEPLVAVVDGQPIAGETASYLALARTLLPGITERVWKRKNKKRKPLIIGRGP